MRRHPLDGQCSDFKDAVMTALPELEGEEIAKHRGWLTNLYMEGFTIEEAIRFARYTEEVSPDLDEDYALKKMAEISAVVRAREEGNK